MYTNNDRKMGFTQKICQNIIISTSLISKKRKKLIEMVASLKKTIVQSARQLKVKLSTAKLILKKFKETGSFFDKKMPNYCRRKKREV